MFDFAWSELALIGVVALVAIGPKDMPVAIKSVAGLVKKARRLAGEFHTHVDDLMKEAELSDVRSQFNELRSFNLRDQVKRAVDPDGSLHTTFTDNPFHPAPDITSTTDSPEGFVGVRPEHMIRDPDFSRGSMGPVTHEPIHTPSGPDHRRPMLDAAPAFIPPEAVLAEQALRAAPAFIPPEAAMHGCNA